MSKLFNIILPLIVWFGLGWIAKEIYFHYNVITTTTKIQEIYNGEIISYGCVAALYNITYNTFFGKDDLIRSAVSWSPLLITCIIICIPMNLTAAIIFNILCIASMIAVGLLK